MFLFALHGSKHFLVNTAHPDDEVEQKKGERRKREVKNQQYDGAEILIFCREMNGQM